MHKDLKIGLVLGLILVIFITLRLATDPSLTPQARLQQSHNTASQSESPNLPTSPIITKTPAPKSDTGKNNNKPVTSEAINHSATSTKTETAPETKEQTAMKESTANEQAAKIKPQRFHIVLKGETLSEIAYKYYGSAAKWNKILDANRSVIKDADKLKPGTKIIIPE